jgi:hypothetical protein
VYGLVIMNIESCVSNAVDVYLEEKKVLDEERQVSRSSQAANMPSASENSTTTPFIALNPSSSVELDVAFSGSVLPESSEGRRSGGKEGTGSGEEGRGSGEKEISWEKDGRESGEEGKLSGEKMGKEKVGKGSAEKPGKGSGEKVGKGSGEKGRGTPVKGGKGKEGKKKKKKETEGETPEGKEGGREKDSPEEGVEMEESVGKEGSEVKKESPEDTLKEETCEDKESNKMKGMVSEGGSMPMEISQDELMKVRIKTCI